MNPFQSAARAHMAAILAVHGVDATYRAQNAGAGGTARVRVSPRDPRPQFIPVPQTPKRGNDDARMTLIGLLPADGETATNGVTPSKAIASPADGDTLEFADPADVGLDGVGPVRLTIVGKPSRIERGHFVAEVKR